MGGALRVARPAVKGPARGFFCNFPDSEMATQKPAKEVPGQTSAPPSEREFVFRFPDNQRKDLICLFEDGNPTEFAGRFIEILEYLVWTFRQSQQIEPQTPPSSARRELRAFEKTAKECEKFLEDEGLSQSAWERLTPALAHGPIQNLLPQIPENIYRNKEPFLWREYQKTLYLIIRALRCAVEETTTLQASERAGGRPPIARKKMMVAMAVEGYCIAFRKLPPTTKESAFEQALRQCLEAVPFPETENLGEMIRHARLIVEKYLPSKTPT